MEKRLSEALGNRKEEPQLWEMGESGFIYAGWTHWGLIEKESPIFYQLAREYSREYA